MTHTAPSPLLTATECVALTAARAAGLSETVCSLDLGRSRTRIEIGPSDWGWHGRRFAYPGKSRPHTVYYWSDSDFVPVARYGASLVKLVPTPWGAPTFEIDGIKMLPSARFSPFEDARRKVALIEPRGKRVLDTCGGLGYFAAWCIEGQATAVHSFEKNADVLWLRSVNPWSPSATPPLHLLQADVLAGITALEEASMDAVLHDPPRFGIAGELYSESFYRSLARVLKRGGKLFHYTGSPHAVSRGRNLGAEVSGRLRHAGFEPVRSGDGVLAVKRGRPERRPRSNA